MSPVTSTHADDMERRLAIAGDAPVGASSPQVAERGISRDPARVTLAVLFIAGMVVLSFLVLRPFLPAAVWAVTIVVATWPLMLSVERVLWRRRGLAVCVMTALLLLVLIVPLALAVMTIVGHIDQIVGWAREAASWTVPPPPSWVGRLPLVGKNLAARWGDFAQLSHDQLTAQLSPYSGRIAGWVLGTIGGIGVMLVQFLLVVIIAAVLYAFGEAAAGGARRFARRIAGPRGDSYFTLGGQAIRGVALGIVVTALLQTALAWIGLVVAGAPFAAVLTAVAFVFCIAQVGAVLPLLLAVGWLYWSGENVWGTALLVWTLFVGSIDNVIRPVLIKKGADLPLALVFLGVIGGLLAFGIIGLFIGPVVLAVGYTLLADWIAGGEAASPEAAHAGDGPA